MKRDQQFCDDCGDPLKGKNFIPFARLPWAVESACKGESAVVCKPCVKKHEAIGKLWKRDDVQFPRLLAEINAVGLTSGQAADICDSMDLSKERLKELFERAEIALEKIKAKHTRRAR